MYSTMHTIQHSEESGLVGSKNKRWEKPRNRFFQSSITTLPGPSITIRDEQIPYTQKAAEHYELARTEPPKSTVDPSDRSDAVSVTTTESSFKNEIPKLYGGKFSPQNIPQVDFRKRK